MFEDLKKGIALENLNKIKKNHQMFRYHSESSSNNQDPNEDSLSDIDIHIDQAQLPIESQEEEVQTFLKIDPTTPHKLKKIEHELEMSNEKLKLQERSHKRELEFVEEVHRRKQQWLNSEIDRLNIMIQQIKQDNSKFKNVQKQLAAQEQIKELLEERMRKKQIQNKQLQQKLAFCEIEYKKILKDKFTEIKQETKGETHEKIRHLQGECEQWKRIANQREKKYSVIKSEISRVKNQQNEAEIHHNNEIRNLKNQYEGRIQKLQSVNYQLTKRNQEMESTLIEKINSLTKLQVTLMSNENSHPIVNSSLDLRQESPIKNQTSKNWKENPEITQCACCQRKMEKMKKKLNEANNKIMQLLEQKLNCEGIPYKNRNRTYTQLKK